MAVFVFEEESRLETRQTLLNARQTRLNTRQTLPNARQTRLNTRQTLPNTRQTQSKARQSHKLAQNTNTINSKKSKKEPKYACIENEKIYYNKKFHI